MVRFDRVLQGIPVQFHSDHVATGRFHGFLNRHRNLAGLASAEADTPIAITHHCQRGKAEYAAAFNHFGYTVHLNQLFLQAFSVFTVF